MLFFLGYEKCCENFASKNSKPKKEKKEKKGGLFITQQLLNQIAQLGASSTKSFSLEPKLPNPYAPPCCLYLNLDSMPSLAPLKLLYQDRSQLGPNTQFTSLI